MVNSKIYFGDARDILDEVREEFAKRIKSEI